jgi:hypothetical protein
VATKIRRFFGETDQSQSDQRYCSELLRLVEEQKEISIGECKIDRFSLSQTIVYLGKRM